MPRTYIPTGRPAGRPPELFPTDVMAELGTMPGGFAPSKRVLCERLRCSHGALDRVITLAVESGWVELVPGPRRAMGYRMVTENE